ncbi:hypothetical protein QBC41DRAFT_333783 [Cercophora samala]|uniref:U1-C C2H2-type zinc finger domain-containing protein n=1 Tax=Cercophora samala TaxID=330535 RepID=A0AA40DG62_9PEZI|nr:hypothetical protein QBC41DRAFT_333783 [Cercophora samala]
MPVAMMAFVVLRDAAVRSAVHLAGWLPSANIPRQSLIIKTLTMSEYWKSTPKYWCKHCSVYVRDTKLERANHESTGKHQGAIKRSLRDLHRSADQEQREKDRAKREVERLNGVVSGSGSGSSSSSATGAKKYGGSSSSAPPPAPTGQLSQAERQRQLEQLAELGVNIPTELRKDMAMVGEWSVTSTRVIDDAESANKTEDTKDDGRAVGVKRERERTEEEKEQEEALNGLFKKRKRWGVGSRSMPEEEDKELEELLSGTIVKPKKETGTEVKDEVKEEDAPQVPAVKKEESQDGPALEAIQDVKDEAPPAVVKQEPGEGDALPAVSNEAPAVAAVVFKKRKPKNIRQK